ncbi:MAG: TonB-dependent receptor, partial [Vicinamibacterales bacterium]|nr:TonB-dependent receptor [Vicinamibacterales bacterium]
MRVPLPALPLPLLLAAWMAFVPHPVHALPAPSQGATVGVTGTLLHSLSGDPVADATITVEPMKRSTRTKLDGTFAIDGVPAGSYVFVAAADGFVTTRRDVRVVAGGGPVVLTIDPVLEFTESVSVQAENRSAFAAAQPIAVLSGQDLGRELEGSLGAALKTQPGVAERSSGPGASRPIIRGLDGDRVLILEDTHGMGDVSSQSADHGVAINPATAAKIEVVRGPATLLYGSNAIGGLVNVVTNTIVTEVKAGDGRGTRGTVTLDGGTGASEGGVAGSYGWTTGPLVWHVSGAGRKSGDVRTPERTIDHTSVANGQGTVGLSWVGTRGYVGAAYGYDRASYGVPALDGGGVELTPRRHSLTARAERRDLPGLASSMRASFAYRNYLHDESEDGVAGTRFTNTQAEGNVFATHRPLGRITGTWGAAGLMRSFSATGAEALTPPVDVRAGALFVFEEVSWTRLSIQGGVRAEFASYRPERDRRPRDFNDLSFSGGIVWQPDTAVTLAASVARTSRRPALEELYFDGLHIGNYAYEVGNGDLGSERAFGIDTSFRWRHARASGEVTLFRNAITDFIFRQPTGRTIDGYPEVRFNARDGVLTGIEVRGETEVAPGVFAEVGLDYIRAWLVEGDTPLPRIPPMRTQIGGRYQRGAWQAGATAVINARQDRVYPGEAPTDGATVLRLHAAWSFEGGGALNTVTLRVENATDRLYRSHLSYLKAAVPEMGRNIKLVYTAA